jgi:hypothetical protein
VPPIYGHHQIEGTLLYRLVAEHYSGLRDRLMAEGKPLQGTSGKSSRRI